LAKALKHFNCLYKDIANTCEYCYQMTPSSPNWSMKKPIILPFNSETDLNPKQNQMKERRGALV